MELISKKKPWYCVKSIPKKHLWTQQTKRKENVIFRPMFTDHCSLFIVSLLYNIIKMTRNCNLFSKRVNLPAQCRGIHYPPLERGRVVGTDPRTPKRGPGSVPTNFPYPGKILKLERVKSKCGRVKTSLNPRFPRAGGVWTPSTPWIRAWPIAPPLPLLPRTDRSRLHHQNPILMLEFRGSNEKTNGSSIR